MRSKINRIVLALALLIALMIIFSSVAFAADSTPRYIVYQNDALEYVRGDYRQAIEDLLNGDARLRNALRGKLVSAIGGFRDVFVIAESGRAIDFQKAVTDSVSYLDAYANPIYWEANPPQPTRELTRDGSEVSLVRVDSVSAVNDLTGGTFTVTAKLTAEPAVVPDEDAFDVVVEIDGVEAPDYDDLSWSGAPDLEATFTWAAIPQKATEQEVDFSVAYKDTPPVSDSITIAPVLIEVVSVVPVSRTTIRATLEDDTDPAAAANVANYTVTVGGDAIAVTAASFDAATDVVTLTVDLTGKDGLCIVNGVEAALEVPKVPVFKSITTMAGSFKVVLNFNADVYDLNGDLVPGNFTVLTDDLNNPVLDVDVARTKNTARSTITLTLSDRTPGDTVTQVSLSAAGAATIVNIFEEASAPAVNWELTPEDLNPPLFTGVRAVEGGYVIYLDFSEDVYTDGQILNVGTLAADDVRVSVAGTLVDGDNIDGITDFEATDSIMVKLDLARADLLKTGVTTSATLDLRLQDSSEPKHIRDLSENVFAGQRTRSATYIQGPGFTTVQTSDLAIGQPVQQTFSFTLDGKLESGEQVWIDVSAAAANVRAAYAAGAYAVNPAASMNVNYNAANARFEVTAISEIADGTSAVVTVSGLDTLLVNPAGSVEAFFQRRDYGTNKTDTFSIGSGFSTLNVPNLVSGLDDQTFNGLTFRLEGALASGRRVTIDLSSLAAAGVDFSKVSTARTKDNSTNADNFNFAFSGNVMTLTATANITDKTLVNLNFRGALDATDIIDVDPGATGDDYEVIFTRNDTLVSSTFNAEIEANIINGSAEDLNNDQANQSQDFFFTVDGKLSAGKKIMIKINDSEDVVYSDDLNDYEVFGANADVTDVDVAMGDVNPWITITAIDDIESNTNIRVEVDDVDTSGVVEKTIDVEIDRDDNGNFDTFEFLVGDASGTVTVSTPLGLKNALDDPDVDTIILAGGALDIDSNGEIYKGQGTTEQTVIGDLTVSGDNNTFEDFTLQGDINQTGGGNDWAVINIVAASPGGNFTLAAGKKATFDDVYIEGDFTVGNNAEATFTGTSTIGGNLIIGEDADVELGENVQVDGDIELPDDKIWNSRTGGLFDTIQGAMDAASEGDTLYTGAGQFDGDVTINKEDLTLQALGTAAIRGSIYITEDDVIIDGFKFDTIAPGRLKNDSLIVIDNAISVTLRNLDIVTSSASLDPTYTIDIRAGSDNTLIENCTFKKEDGNVEREIKIVDVAGTELVENHFEGLDGQRIGGPWFTGTKGDVTVINNTVINAWGEGITINQGAAAATQDIVLQGNVITLHPDTVTKHLKISFEPNSVNGINADNKADVAEELFKDNPGIDTMELWGDTYPPSP